MNTSLLTKLVHMMCVWTVLMICFAQIALSNQLLEHKRFLQKDLEQYIKDGSKVRWEFNTKRKNMYINLEILILNLGKEDSDRCYESLRLEIYSLDNNMRKRLFTFCGNTPPKQVQTHSRHIEVLVSGDPAYLPQYSMNYLAMNVYMMANPSPMSTDCVCGGDLHLQSDIIRSPRFPSMYPSNCHCEWPITTNGGSIKFVFQELDLENEGHGGECRDYVEIFQGHGSSKKSKGKYCTSRGDHQAELVTSGETATVVFQSDSMEQANSRGFELRYQSIKIEELTGLKSVAAILGAVSFGIFVCLLVCSVLYKRASDRQDGGQDNCQEVEDPANDYTDVVQASAPPSYMAVMTNLKDYPPTTPEKDYFV